MIVANDLLGYKKYVIYQETNMFNFSTDSMLLASFATILGSQSWFGQKIFAPSSTI